MQGNSKPELFKSRTLLNINKLITQIINLHNNCFKNICFTYIRNEPIQ